MIFICSGVSNNILISEQICANSAAEANIKFLEQHSIPVQISYGPFRPHRIKIIKPEPTTLRFSGKQIKVIYEGWNVNAMILKEPIDHAYLIFLNPVNQSSRLIKQKNIVIPISQLQETS